ncbi:MAG: sugar phosphate isomerase/epimerase family protein [bacterium]
MATLSAFADEAMDDFKSQIDFLRLENINCIEIRFVNKKNVVELTCEELSEVKRILNENDVRVSAIASPIGKVRIDEPFGPHLDKFKHAVEIAHFLHAPFIRIFSYYPPEGKNIGSYRTEILERMNKKVTLLKDSTIRIVHENETDIYGSTPENCVDLVRSVNSPQFRLAYDPANFVSGQKRTNSIEDCWPQMKPYVDHVHLKDWKLGSDHIGSMPGEGDAQIPELLADLAIMEYEGFLTIEPHLKSGGQFSGETGPELFSQAITRIRNLALTADLSCG